MLTHPRAVEVAYHPDTASRIDALAAREWSVLLDSGWPRSRQGRFDIVAGDPYLTLTTSGMQTEIRSRDRVEVSEDDPFAILKRHLGAPVPRNPRLPFAGGAMGYFAYDLGRRIEHLPALAANDIDLPDMAIGFYDWALVVDHQDRRAWLVGEGRDEKTFDEWQSLLAAAEPETPVAFCPSFQVLSAVHANMTRDEYADRFERIKRYLRNGDCYQVNLTQRFSARAAGDPWDAFKYLRQLNPAPYSAFLRVPGGGAVLSSSPERFLKVCDGVVETKPIKGTRPRHAEPARDQRMVEELQHSLKDRAENLMIVDLLRNDIGKNCAIGSVRVPSLFAVESFATVHHLVSTITGRLVPGRHALDLLRGCFPGGSITGAPKLRAMQIIEELEPHRRGIYCGAIGYIGFDGSMDTNIAIRTLVYHNGQMHAWAGGGIVMDSVMEDEYQESLDKAAAMLKLFMRTEGQFVRDKTA